MIFEHPQILFGLFLLGIPVLIHFLNFRRTRTIYFSSLKFLRDIETSHRSRRNLQDLLLLLLRLLVFACILFAFSKPVIVSKSGLAPRNGVVGIFIDNSESMGIPFGEASWKRPRIMRYQSFKVTLRTKNSSSFLMTTARSTRDFPMQVRPLKEYWYSILFCQQPQHQEFSGT